MSCSQYLLDHCSIKSSLHDPYPLNVLLYSERQLGFNHSHICHPSAEGGLADSFSACCSGIAWYAR